MSSNKVLIYSAISSSSPSSSIHPSSSYLSKAWTNSLPYPSRSFLLFFSPISWFTLLIFSVYLFLSSSVISPKLTSVPPVLLFLLSSSIIFRRSHLTVKSTDPIQMTSSSPSPSSSLISSSTLSSCSNSLKTSLLSCILVIWMGVLPLKLLALTSVPGIERSLTATCALFFQQAACRGVNPLNTSFTEPAFILLTKSPILSSSEVDIIGCVVFPAGR